MRKYQWVAAATFLVVQSVAALGEVPTTPGPDVEQLAGGNGSDAYVRPGLRSFLAIKALFTQVSLREVINRDETLAGLRYRKLRNLSMIDLYPAEGFHLSYGFRSWKGKLAARGFAVPGSVGRLDLNAVAPLLPVRSAHSNLSPMMTAGYQANMSRFGQLGFEAGMLNESGRDRANNLPGERNQRWASTAGIAQVSYKLRFF